jgi:hypothetical protein
MGLSAYLSRRAQAVSFGEYFGVPLRNLGIQTAEIIHAASNLHGELQE